MLYMCALSGWLLDECTHVYCIWCEYNRLFYRPLPVVSDLIAGFRGLGLDEKKVVLSIEEIDNDIEYKLVLKETSDGDFIVDSEVDVSDVNWTLKADFLCFGRYFTFKLIYS